jgi:hypothetical protein
MAITHPTNGTVCEAARGKLEEYEVVAETFVLFERNPGHASSYPSASSLSVSAAAGQVG